MTRLRQKRLEAERAQKKRVRETKGTQNVDISGWKPKLQWIAILAQAIALFLLIVEVVRLIGNDFYGANFTQLAIYSGLFLTGRVLQMVTQFTR